MMLIICLAVVGIAAIEIMDNTFSKRADKTQRRMTECAIAMMAAAVCIGMVW
jgi:hypothetical protein